MKQTHSLLSLLQAGKVLLQRLFGDFRRNRRLDNRTLRRRTEPQQISLVLAQIIHHNPLPLAQEGVVEVPQFARLPVHVRTDLPRTGQLIGSRPVPVGRPAAVKFRRLDVKEDLVLVDRRIILPPGILRRVSAGRHHRYRTTGQRKKKSEYTGK